jgi:HEXXH motif-containing protein
VGGSPPSQELSYLQLPSGVFASIAAGHLREAVVEVLRDSERSRRLLLLQHLLIGCRRDPLLLAPLGGIDPPQALLELVQDQQPEALEQLLAYPHTGMWLAHAVRLIEGSTLSTLPLWVDLGGISAIAASAALRSGTPFEINLPVRRGQVLFPSLGRVNLAGLTDDAAGRCAVATVRFDGWRVAIEGCGVGVELHGPLDLGRSTGTWTAIPVVRAVGASGRVFQVSLDHVDPAPRAVGLPPPSPLSASDLPRWHDQLAMAWRMLDADHPDEAEALAAGMSAVVPLADRDAGVLTGTSAEGFGAAVITLPGDVADLACALVHEFHHSALNGLLHLVKLCEPEAGPPVHYVPWRDDPRPLPAVLHGAYAFSAVTAFWQRRAVRESGAAARRAELEFALWRHQTIHTLARLASSDRLTVWGQQVVEQLRQRSGAWSAHAVSPQAARLALIAARSHHAAWRTHRIHPSPTWVDAATREWLAGRAAPPVLGEAVIVDSRVSGLNRMFALAHVEYVGSGGLPPRGVKTPAAKDRDGADHLLIGGESARARDRYLAEIAADPGDPHPWAGLGPALASAATDPDHPSPAIRTLLDHPERVRAVHRRLRAVTREPLEVVELAGWLGTVG